jgi:hypothetical protein
MRKDGRNDFKIRSGELKTGLNIAFRKVFNYILFFKFERIEFEDRTLHK